MSSKERLSKEMKENLVREIALMMIPVGDESVTDKDVDIEKFYFKEDQIIKLLQLYDIDSKENSRMGHYNLWTYVHECFPELHMGDSLGLCANNVFSPYVTTKKKKLMPDPDKK